MEDEDFDVDALIDGLIEREGGYVNHPADKGGPTCFGITEAVARAHGYARRDAQSAAQRRRRPSTAGFTGCGRASTRSPGDRTRIAAELFDTGVNMGPAVATTFLQRALTALNRNARDYADLTPDGRVGPMTLHALDAFLADAREDAAARPC